MFNPQEFFSAAVAGIPLFVVILLLVETLKSAGLKDRALFLSSLFLGTLIGVGFQIYASGFPPDFAGWFAYSIYGLTLGMVASKAHDYMKGQTVAAVEKEIQKYQSPPAEDDQLVG